MGSVAIVVPMSRRGRRAAVAQPTPIPNTESKTVQFGKAWWAILVAQVVAVGAVYAMYYGIKSELALQADAIKAQSVQIDAIKTWIKKPGELPTSNAAPPPGHPSTPSPSASQAPTPASSIASAAASPVGTLKAIPGSVKPITPPVCVAKSTRRAIPCTADLECYGPEAFAPDFLQKIRDDARVSGWMMVCDPKKTKP